MSCVHETLTYCAEMTIASTPQQAACLFSLLITAITIVIVLIVIVFITVAEHHHRLGSEGDTYLHSAADTGRCRACKCDV